MTNPEKLRALADWFDKRDKESGSKSNEVQQDLREIADELERKKYLWWFGKQAIKEDKRRTEYTDLIKVMYPTISSKRFEGEIE